jgi:hypothetical protein
MQGGDGGDQEVTAPRAGTKFSKTTKIANRFVFVIFVSLVIFVIRRRP